MDFFDEKNYENNFVYFSQEKETVSVSKLRTLNQSWEKEIMAFFSLTLSEKTYLFVLLGFYLF